MKRAYSLLTIKAVDDDERVIEGIATTPAVDRVGDIVEPDGAEFKLPLPLLWQHDSGRPIGSVTRASVTEDGIEITARFAKIDEPGALKDRLDEAWQSIKAGLVRGLSIGFKSLESTSLDDGFGLRFVRWLWLELSAVTIPANQEATIQTLKSIDKDLRAASGPSPAGKTSPGVSGHRKPVKLVETDMSKKTIAEQISAFEATRQAKDARMAEIMDEAADSGETLDEAQKEEYDELDAEVKEIDDHLKRLRAREKANLATAKAVEANNAEEGSAARQGIRVSVKEPNLPPGIRFARLARVKALAKLDSRDVQAVARALYPNDPLIEKAAVSAASTSHATWAGPLVGDESTVFADFVEFLRPMTILGRFGTGGIPSLRQVPFRTRLITQSSGGAGYWVGEGQSKELTSFDFAGTTLEPLKVANIAVATMETLRDSSPSAEMIIRDQLAAALRGRLDTDFIDPGKAASAGVSPAAITNGITLSLSSGQDADAVRDDVRTVLNAFVAADNPPTSGVWIMSSQTALALSLMVSTLSQPEFPGISMMGGTFFGLPVLTSEYVANYASSPAQFTFSYVYLVNASDIYFADEGGIEIDMSREASLEMVDTGTQSSISPPGITPSQVVSLWQTNSVGFRAERTLNWSRRRTSAVAGLRQVAWGQGL